MVLLYGYVDRGVVSIKTRFTHTVQQTDISGMVPVPWAAAIGLHDIM